MAVNTVAWQRAATVKKALPMLKDIAGLTGLYAIRAGETETVEMMRHVSRWLRLVEASLPALTTHRVFVVSQSAVEITVVPEPLAIEIDDDEDDHEDEDDDSAFLDFVVS